MNSPRILILNPFGVGDVIFSTPLIELLRKAYSNAYICYICNKRVYDILKSDPNINSILIYEKDEYRECWQQSRLKCLKKILEFLKTIKREGFNILIDMSLGYQTNLLMSLIGIKKRVGFNYRKRGRFLTDKIDIEGFSGRHVVEHYLDMLRPVGIEARPYMGKPKVYLSPADLEWAESFLSENSIGDKDMLIGMIPGCGASWGVDAKYRRWDRKRFAELADRIIDEHDAKVILLGDIGERWICEDVEGAMRHDALIACGKTTLGQALAIMNKCTLIITNDGGPLHMAIGLGVKTVSIFGPVDEKVYGPYPPGPEHIVVSRNDVPCRPCYRNFKYNLCDDRKCLDSITSEDVFRAVSKLLKP